MAITGGFQHVGSSIRDLEDLPRKCESSIGLSPVVGCSWNSAARLSCSESSDANAYEQQKQWRKSGLSQPSGAQLQVTKLPSMPVESPEQIQLL